MIGEKRIYLSGVIISFLFCGAVISQVLNPSFEYYTVDANMNRPNDWQCEYYVSVHEEFTPYPEHGQDDRGEMQWRIDYPLLPYDGNHFVLLSTGDIGLDKPDNPDNPEYSVMFQQVSFLAGEKLSGRYFFGTCDYVDSGWFNDWATITLVAEPNSGLPDIELVDIDIAEVGSYSSTDGWQYFEHIFDVNDQGTYQLQFFVSDYADIIYKSYLAVDGLRLYTPCFPSNHPDFNEWLVVGEPNCWCYPRQCHADADGQKQGQYNYWVSTADLLILRNAWQKPLEQLVGDEICADFDHSTQGKNKYRVSTADLAILRSNWQIPNGPEPNCLTDY